MLQLMCEGHNTSNQVMMHEQPMNANSVVRIPPPPPPPILLELYAFVIFQNNA